MSRPARRRDAGWLSLAIALGAGSFTTGCVDTELGLDAVIDSARVTVAPDGLVTVRIDITYRVGEYAEESRVFQPQGMEVYTSDDTLVARTSITAPPTFVTNVDPGESFSAPLLGMDDMAADPRAICGTEVRVLFRWLDATMMEIGQTSTVTSDVTCE